MIKAHNIHKSFDGEKILRGVDICINAGEFVSVMGKSGSGKSTLLNILAANLRADEGSVMLDGEDITCASEKRLAYLRRTSLGFVYQSLNLIPTLSARDNILLPLYLNGERATDKNKELMQTAEFLEIDRLLYKMPAELSGGERQRVAIAKSLIHAPKIIMLDEPTGSLDSKNSQKVMELLRRINTDMGVTVLQVTHSYEMAQQSDRIILLHDGEVAAE